MMRMMRGSIRRQRGATLLISLIMLVVLTLFAVAGFNLSSVNLKIAGNFQNQKFMEAVALQAIEWVISTPTAFFPTPAAAQTITVAGYNVSISAPVCNYWKVAPGTSTVYGTPTPQDTDWEFRATVTDAVSGAQAAIVQGVRMRLPQGNCP